MLTTRFRQLAFSVLLLLIVQSGLAQQTAAELNKVHDKMVLLMQQSSKVLLPDEISQKIAEINRHDAYKAKKSFAQTSFLKVIYNKELKKEDISFFVDQLLKNNSATISPIHFLVKQKMKE